MFQINSVRVAECPASYITPDSRLLLSLLNEGRHAHEATGAAMFGGDVMTWPAWWCDAVVAVECARIDENNARMKAEFD